MPLVDTKSRRGVEICFVLLLLAGMMVMLTAVRIHATTLAKLPEKIQAAIFVKILSMSKEIVEQDEITIHVLNAPGVASEMRKAVGRSIGDGILVEVNEDPGLPERTPSVVYIGDCDDVASLIQYCRRHRVLSMTGSPELVEQGVTLALASTDGKPAILLNVVATNEEKITWSPSLLKLATIYK